jgi:hypothetical protein
MHICASDRHTHHVQMLEVEKALKLAPEVRRDSDLACIVSYLKTLDLLERLQESHLTMLAKAAGFESKDSGMCVCMCLRVCLFVCMCVHEYVFMRMSICEFECICMCMHTYVTYSLRTCCHGTMLVKALQRLPACAHTQERHQALQTHADT